jgi:hypothetical protein
LVTAVQFGEVADASNPCAAPPLTATVIQAVEAETYCNARVAADVPALAGIVIVALAVALRADDAAVAGSDPAA